MKKVYLLSLVLFIAGCQKNKPVESLTYEEKEAITKECQANGKIQTDDYCKQVAFVYGEEFVKRSKEAARKNWENNTSYPKNPY